MLPILHDTILPNEHLPPIATSTSTANAPRSTLQTKTNNHPKAPRKLQRCAVARAHRYKYNQQLYRLALALALAVAVCIKACRARKLACICMHACSLHEWGGETGCKIPCCYLENTSLATMSSAALELHSSCKFVANFGVEFPKTSLQSHSSSVRRSLRTHFVYACTLQLGFCLLSALCQHTHLYMRLVHKVRNCRGDRCSFLLDSSSSSKSIAYSCMSLTCMYRTVHDPGGTSKVVAQRIVSFSRRPWVVRSTARP
jgi:hypothetical protein